MCRVLVTESKMKLNLARENLKHNSLTDGRYFFHRGLEALGSLCLQRTSRTPQKAIETAPLIGKHNLNEDDFGTNGIICSCFFH